MHKQDSAASEVLRAALAALQAESPVMYKQIQAVSNETLAAQRDRTRALNAKGVFSAHINEVRSRTQTRVELSNRIAAASSKLLEKMVKEAMMVQASSLLMKIERIHSLLLDSYAERMKEDVSSAAAARAAAAGMVQSGSAALSKLKGAVGSMTGLAAPGATAAVAAAGKAPSGQTRASNTSIAWAKPEAGGVTSRSMESDVSVRIDWDNVPLEVCSCVCGRDTERA